MFDVPPERWAGVPHTWAFYSWRNFGISVWRKPATQDSATQVAELSARVRDAHPRGYSIVHMVLAKSGVPDTEARSVFTRNLSDHIDRVTAVGILIEEQGFIASAVRSAITAILFMGPRNFPVFIKDDIDSLCTRLVDEHRRRNDPVDQAGLLSALLLAHSKDD